MRLGGQVCKICGGSLGRETYGNPPEITERHRHRYEVNKHFAGSSAGNKGLRVPAARRAPICAR